MARESAQAATQTLNPPTGGWFQPLWSELRKNPLLLTALALLAVFLGAAVFANVLAPYAATDIDLRNRIQPPSLSGAHALGTDALGRDVLSQIIFGIRTSLFIGGAATILAALFGGLLGIFAGYFGGWFETLLMRVADMQLTIPAFFFALAGSVLIGRGVVSLTIVLALVSWAQFARIARGSTLAVSQEAFVEAARGLGAGNTRIGLRHLLPNVLAPLLIVFSINLPHAIMIEASLSFIGMGLPPTVPSLGSIISVGYTHLLSGAWWISILPGVALMLIVLSINTITDALRDLLDVRR